MLDRWQAVILHRISIKRWFFDNINHTFFIFIIDYPEAGQFEKSCIKTNQLT